MFQAPGLAPRRGRRPARCLQQSSRGGKIARGSEGGGTKRYERRESWLCAGISDDARRATGLDDEVLSSSKLTCSYVLAKGGGLVQSVKCFVKSVVLVISIACVPAAYAIVTGLTTAAVIVHATPDGKPSGTLKRGTLVGVLGTSGKWVKVMYINPPGTKQVKVGWIESSRLYIRAPTGARDCKSEYKTNAQVCISVSNKSLDCNPNFDGDGYRSCEVTVDYDVSTDYTGGSYLDADIECEANIEHTGPEMYSWRSDSSTQDNNYSLYAYASQSDSFTFDFSFSSFEKVTRAKIDSVNCTVNSVNMW